MIGTYGRALWAGDITPLQELSAAVLEKPVHLFEIEPRANYNFSVQGMNYHLYGDKKIETRNEPEALAVHYYLKADAPAAARITVADAAGRVVRTMEGPAKQGLNRAFVNLAGSGGGRGGRQREGGGAPPVPALTVGDYKVSVDVAGATLSTGARVRERIR